MFFKSPSITSLCFPDKLKIISIVDKAAQDLALIPHKTHLQQLPSTQPAAHPSNSASCMCGSKAQRALP